MRPVTPDRSWSLSSVTIDSSLVYPTTSRRFLMALWEMEDRKVELLPRTVKETWGFVQDSEIEYWGRRLAKEAERTATTVPPDVARAIKEAAAVTAGVWINAEVGYAGRPGRNDSMLRAVTLTAEQDRHADAIARAIPGECFKGASKNNHWGDRQIIAQGIVSGFKILASDNRASIRRTQTNGWLIDERLAEAKFVLNADDAIDEAGPWKEQPAHMLEAVLRATLPTRPTSPDREKEIVEQFLSRMRNEGLPNTADSCAHEWEGVRANEIRKRARAYIEGPRTHARETEDRRVRATRAAAHRAGYRELEHW